MTKTKKEQSAAEKFNLQRRALNTKQRKKLVVSLVKAMFQPMIDALQKERSEFGANLIKERMSEEIAVYNERIATAVKPVEQLLDKERYHFGETIQNVHTLHGYQSTGGHKTSYSFEYLSPRNSGSVSFETCNELDKLGFDQYRDLVSGRELFDISSLKIPQPLPALTVSQISLVSSGVYFNAGDGDAVYLAMKEFDKRYAEIVKQAVDMSYTLKGIVDELKKPEEIYLTLPDSLPFLPVETKKPKQVKTSTQLIASGEAERINNMLKKAS